jgi:hypothetical protein
MPFNPHPDNPDLVIYKPSEYWIPKPWVGLTDEEIISSSKFFDYMTNEELIDAVRELEAKLKEKNEK